MTKENQPPSEENIPGNNQATVGVEDTFKDYFLQYASYVITDRAIPDIDDGLKPVQRRIMHSLWENEDGRYNKVANLVGHSMKYHPHGDASIYSAMVVLGQKELLIDTQGNWGDPITNDSPAAARYIEARLTPFAKEVLFAPHLTRYKRSYDGRSKEPLTLPSRFPLLLALGAEGIAVGLTTRILPHNFIELLEAQKAYLRGEPFELYPDFPTGGMVDVKDYADGQIGSRVKVRAVIEKSKAKYVTIRQIAYGTTTESLIDSILKASEKGKIKVANIQDNSAAEIEIVVSFQRGVDMDKAEDALYAFTECESTLSANGMVIRDNVPVSLSVSEVLIENTNRTRDLLREDLQIELEKLERDWHLKSLVQIFIENRVYLRIEKCETWVDVLYEIDQGLQPHIKHLRREVTEEDLEYLTEVKIRRISKWDSEKAREELLKIDDEIKRVKRDLADITGYTIRWIDHLLEKYGKGRERRTTIENFDSIKAVTVVERTSKLYVDKAGGFIGTDLKDAEEVGPCSLLDDVLVLLADGGLIVVKVPDKKYVGENIVHAQLVTEEEKDAVFNVVYEDLKSGRTLAKRFRLGGFTRERRYELGSSEKTSILYFSKGDGAYCHVKLRKKPRIKTDLYIRFDEILVKGRSANGITVTKHKVSSVKPISENVYCNRLEMDPDDLLPLTNTAEMEAEDSDQAQSESSPADDGGSSRSEEEKTSNRRASNADGDDQKLLF